MKRILFLALILCATIAFTSCSKDDKEESKAETFDWILDYLHVIRMGSANSHPLSIDTLHIDTLYSRTMEEINSMADAYRKVEQYATIDGTRYVSDIIAIHIYTEMRTIKKDWGYQIRYMDDEVKKNQSLYRSYQGSYKNITEVAALDSARSIVKKYGHDLLWLSVWDEVANVVVYECGSRTATK